VQRSIAVHMAERSPYIASSSPSSSLQLGDREYRVVSTCTVSVRGQQPQTQPRGLHCTPTLSCDLRTPYTRRSWCRRQRGAYFLNSSGPDIQISGFSADANTRLARDQGLRRFRSRVPNEHEVKARTARVYGWARECGARALPCNAGSLTCTVFTRVRVLTTTFQMSGRELCLGNRVSGRAAPRVLSGEVHRRPHHNSPGRLRRKPRATTMLQGFQEVRRLVGE